MVLGAQVKSLPGSGPIFLIGRGQAGSLVSRVTWEITSDPWEGNKIYRKEDGKSWLDPHHISEKAKREPSVPAGSLHVRTHTHTHTHTQSETQPRGPVHGAGPKCCIRIRMWSSCPLMATLKTIIRYHYRSSPVAQQ